jgi:hypothetical protein
VLISDLQPVAQPEHRRPDARLGGSEWYSLVVGDFAGRSSEVGGQHEGAALLLGERRQRLAQLIPLEERRVLLVRIAVVGELELGSQQIRVERLGGPDAAPIDGGVSYDLSSQVSTVPRRAS